MPVMKWIPRSLQWGCVLLLWLGFPAFAQVPMADLYEARVVVPEDQAANTGFLFRQGLDQVVRRLAGPGVRLLNARPEDLASRYGYQRDAQNHMVFVVDFDEKAVVAALNQQGAALWKSPRPVSLLWLTTASGAAVVTEESADPALIELKRQAWLLGLPLQVPPAGFRPAPSDDPASLAVGPLGAGTAALLVVAATTHPDGRWSAEFRTYIDGQMASSWAVAPAALEAMLASGMQTHEALLRKRFAQATVPQSMRVMRIAVSGIEDYADYAQVAAVLQSQRALSDLFLEEAGPEELVWRAATALSPESMLGLLEESGQLRGRFAGEPAHPDRLELQWMAIP